MQVDPRSFRDALSCFATGVTIVTTVSRTGQPVGLTVNSFSSLSLDPPLVLFCLGKSSDTAAEFLSAPGYVVNVLARDQQDLAEQFARKPAAERFNGVDYQPVSNGMPLLNGCIAHYICDRHSILEGGDHHIMIGKVEELRSADGEPQPLLYYRGQYWSG